MDILCCTAWVRFWHEAADRGSATSRQILRVEQTCHGRRGTAESDPQETRTRRRRRVGNGPLCSRAQSIHSLTWAARSDGKDKPSFSRAVRFALMVNCVGPAIGKSAGLAPGKILSTYLAAP